MRIIKQPIWMRSACLAACVTVACASSDEPAPPGATVGAAGGAGGVPTSSSVGGAGGSDMPQRCRPSPLEVVDDNTISSPTDMYRHDIAVDARGNVYSAVSSGDRVFVRTSGEGGRAWVPTADVPYGTALGRVVVAVAGSVLYVATVGYDANMVRRAVLLKSEAPYQSWVVLDEFPAVALWDLHVTPRGGIFIAGVGPNGSASDGWLVRRGSDGGSFTNVDHLPVTNSPVDEVRADALASDAAGNLFAAGVLNDGVNLVWTVRKSSDDGSSWQQVDGYESNPATWALGLGIAVTDDQSLVVAGEAGEEVGIIYLNRWLLRKSPAGGTSWNTLHRLPDVGAPEIFVARDIAAGEGARLYAIGYQGSANDVGSQFVLASSTDGGASFELTTLPFVGGIRTDAIADRVTVGSDGIVYASRGDAILAMCPE